MNNPNSQNATDRTEEIRRYFYKYAAMGLPVIPLCPHNHEGMSERHKETCRHPGKVPLFKGWQEAAPPSQAKINHWLSKCPSCNIGLVLGENSSIIGIDVDGEKGFDILERLSQGFVPSTWQFSTPSGGMRYLYKIPEGSSFTSWVERHPTESHCEVNVLGSGRQTVLPPSIHTNGGQYQWIIEP
ncbi:bifunctional DNA primase/polymerase [Paenibacillus sp. EKM202P]|uniref:bifunctional DNA primase/polymerase n=1 Tax=Paenibacillus TaxID=44249 RepID=UPI0013EA319B|nr:MULTISPECIES: bifunctional DNA primase/polymerase [Paenibacillus]KAF6558352.1 bifunctional DNA primase/polymerase [Paenibacillus sp. EKM202P]KAF6563286.1 bifunctional DNA primase/polymerase [Paenibacillus sp. EKM207P]URJ36729.1 bifunctional DNA primase/polymerase [Paenibacillus polymyxa]